jgi:hypothetical protein
MDNVGIHVPARQIREFCAFNVNNTVRPSFSQDTITANGMQIFGKSNVSLYDSFCAVERELTVDITLYCFSLIRFVH